MILGLVVALGLLIIVYVFRRSRPVPKKPVLAAEQILDALIDALVVFDIQGTILSVNKALLALTGFTRAELIGKPITVLFEASAVIQELRQRGTLGNHELYCRCGNSQTALVNINASVFPAADKEPALVIAVLRDVREIARHIEELNRQQSALEERSRQVSIEKNLLELANAELADERKAIMNIMEDLEETNLTLRKTEATLLQSSKMAAVGQLAGGVAHELNNPLTGVLNNVQLIKMQASQSDNFTMQDFKDMLDVVEQAASRCKHIVRALLDFSRSSTGAVQPICVNKIIEQAVLLLVQEMRLQNIQIVQELQPVLPPIVADTQLFQQVLLNLMSNAQWAIKKKGTGEGGVIMIKSGYNPQSGMVWVSARDSGIGMPQETLKRIFEPFYTTKQVGEGTGLGLAFVYNIVKQHKGDIMVESWPGEGTMFTIIIPAQNKDEGNTSG